MIFVSHSTKDDEFVTQLHVALRRRGFATWVDHISNIPAGVFWDEALDEALANCNVMIFVMSNAALQSQTVGAEWRQFFRDKKKIIPVIIDNCVPPLLIRNLQYIDFRDNTFPMDRIENLIAALPPEEQKRAITSRTADISDKDVEVGRYRNMASSLNLRMQNRLQDRQMIFLLPDTKNLLPVALKPLLSVGWTDHVSKPDIDLGSYGAKDLGVSRLHAMLNTNSAGVRIVDLASANGTFIDGYRLPPEKPVLLKNKSVLQFARLTMIVFMKD